jgi:hypothetical protein
MDVLGMVGSFVEKREATASRYGMPSGIRHCDWGGFVR